MQTHSTQVGSKAILFASLVYLPLSLVPALGVVGLTPPVWFLFSVLLVFVDLIAFRPSIDLRYILVASFWFSLAAVCSLYWGSDLRILAYPMIGLIGLYISFRLTKAQLNHLVDLLSIVALYLLIGALASVAYVLAGGGPFFSLSNPDGRTSHFFGGTFTNFYYPGVIRPSGIFDEPGALSFFVCFVAAARQLLGKDKKRTWLLLLLGFITVSLAHVVYVLCHFLSERFRPRVYLILTLFVLVSTLFVQQIPVVSSIVGLLANRVTITEQGTLSGDNRTSLTSNAISVIDSKVLFFGVDPSFMNPSRVPAIENLGFGENPFSPIVFYGILVGWIYYVVLGLLLFAAFRGRPYWVAMGFLLLLCQRPNVLNIGYCLMAFLIVRLSFAENQNELASITRTVYRSGQKIEGME